VGQLKSPVSLAERKAIGEVTMHPDDELASLRRLLDALETGSMKLLRNNKDVTQEEVAKRIFGEMATIFIERGG